MNRTSFVVPWINTGTDAMWDLRYMLRSIDQMWMGEYNVYVLGDQPPGFKDLWHVKATREKDPFFPRCLDVCTKMEWACKFPRITERFVYQYDDNFYLRPSDLDIVDQRVAMREMTDANLGGGTKHRQLKKRTYQALKQAGLQRVWDYETHTPRVFEKQRMLQVFEKFKPAENRLLFSTLYYNWFWPNQEPQILSRFDSVAVHFYGLGASGGCIHPRADINATMEEAEAHYRRALVGKQFLNYGDPGRHPALLNVLKAEFPEPSPFESIRHAA